MLQIQKIRNISAPKANEDSQAAPRMLKLVLTDGDNYVQAIETAPIPTISLSKTAPGSKLFIKNAKICSGYLLLNSNNCSLLGGRVPALYEKWELAKSVQFYNRQNNSGAPAWVNFGKKMVSDNQDDPKFKSLDNKKEAKENIEFEMQRQGAIAEATSGAIKKVFGGGAKPIQTPSVTNYKKPEPSYGNKRNVKSNKNTEMHEVEEENPQKPPERVSLFDFLEDKLPVKETHNSNHAKPATPNYYNKPQVNTNRNNYNKNTQNSQYYEQKGKNFNSNPNYNVSKTKLNPENNYSNRQPSPRNNNYNNASKNNFPSFQAKTQEPTVEDLGVHLEKMSLNKQFASRSLKQHLNLPPNAKGVGGGSDQTNWQIGDECRAKYWEDGKVNFNFKCHNVITTLL